MTKITMSEESFNDLFVNLTNDIQDAISKHVGALATKDQVMAVGASFGSLAALFTSQSPSNRTLMERMLDYTLIALGQNESFRAGVEAARSGRNPDPAIGLSVPNAHQVASEIDDEHGPHNCLGCAINALIVSRYGPEVRGADLDDVLRSLAASVGAVANSAGIEVVIPFTQHLNVVIANVAARHSIEGMTAQ